MPDKKWRIIRLDSNGNHFVEQDNLDETLADTFLKAREKQIGDHHQTVWKQDVNGPAPWPHVPVVLPPDL